MTAASSTMLQSLSTLERELVCAVLEDCVDQLAVLGGIAPNYVEKPSAVESVCFSVWVYITSGHIIHAIGHGRGTCAYLGDPTTNGEQV